MKGIGTKKFKEFEELSLTKLRKECEIRGIPVSNGAHRSSCIDKLLEYKRAPGAISIKLTPPTFTPPTFTPPTLKEENTAHQFKVGDRVMFIGDNVNNTPNIYDIAGTVENVDLAPEEIVVEWDTGGEQEEDADDLVLIVENRKSDKSDESDEEFFIMDASPMKGADSSTGAIFKSIIKFGSGRQVKTIVKFFTSHHIKDEFAITEQAYLGTPVKLYYTALTERTSDPTTNAFITDQLDGLCSVDMVPKTRKLLETTMVQLGKLPKGKKRTIKKKFGIMIMTNIHSFGKLYQHSSIHGRYPLDGILKKNKYAKRWKFNALHELIRLHKMGIFHGDLNYGNVWVLEKPKTGLKKDIGRVFIIDFGQSKMVLGPVSIMDELNALPNYTKDEKRYRKFSLPVALIKVLENVKMMKSYLLKYPDDKEQLQVELNSLG